MRISYLPEVTSPTSTTFFPVSSAGVSKKVSLLTLNSFSVAGGTVSKVYSGPNVQLLPTILSTTGVASFYFPGSLYPFPGASVPPGWLLCEGQAVSRVTYKNLYNTIGVIYGPGDNRTTFNLPDLRGRTIAGLETMGGLSSSNRLTNSRPSTVNASVLGNIGGTQSYTLSEQEVGLNPHTHSHSLTVSWGGGYEQGNRCEGGNAGYAGSWPEGASMGSAYGLTWGYTFTNNASSNSSSGLHPNLPPLVFLKWVIKY